MDGKITGTEILNTLESPLGCDKDLPDDWKWEQLGSVARVFSGSSAPQGKDFFCESGKPFVRISDLSNCTATGVIEKIRERNYDLKAVNPNRKSEIDTRTPEELLAVIEAKGREITEALKGLA